VSPEYRTTLTGAFPRPEALVQATRDLDRGRIPPERAEAEFASAEAAVARLESELRFDSATGGFLRWPDLFRPFTSLWPGAHVGPLTRFFETNTFYRQPVLDQRPTAGAPGLASWLPHGPQARVILPGPFTFAALADLRYGPDSAADAVVDLASALAGELRSLGPDGPAQVQFQEPMLAYDPKRGGLEGVSRAYQLLAEARPGASLSIWTYFGDGAGVLERTAGLPVDVVGVDLFETRLPSSPARTGRAIGFGCLDPTTTLAEDPDELARLIHEAEGRLRPPTVWLGPTPPFDLLPFDAAVEKVRTLPRLRAALAAVGSARSAPRS
jgi:5-methyltetrahydropteroyltriglutamate--homocysteine methyltransferase